MPVVGDASVEVAAGQAVTPAWVRDLEPMMMTVSDNVATDAAPQAFTPAKGVRAERDGGGRGMGQRSHRAGGADCGGGVALTTQTSRIRAAASNVIQACSWVDSSTGEPAG